MSAGAEVRFTGEKDERMGTRTQLNDGDTEDEPASETAQELDPRASACCSAVRAGCVLTTGPTL